MWIVSLFQLVMEFKTIMRLYEELLLWKVGRIGKEEELFILNWNSIIGKKLKYPDEGIYSFKWMVLIWFCNRSCSFLITIQTVNPYNLCERLVQFVKGMKTSDSVVYCCNKMAMQLQFTLYRRICKAFTMFTYFGANLYPCFNSVVTISHFLSNFHYK